MDRGNTKQEILDAALELFSVQGFEATSPAPSASVRHHFTAILRTSRQFWMHWCRKYWSSMGSIPFLQGRIGRKMPAAFRRLPMTLCK